jgi:hypothetical protein
VANVADSSSSPAPFANPSDVQARWRELDDDEIARAAVLLGDASRYIRRKFTTVDARLGAGELDPDDLTMIVCAMVKRVMLGGDTGDVTEQQETVGPFGMTRRFGNPLGTMYLRDDEAEILEPVAAAGGKRAFVIDLTPGV